MIFLVFNINYFNFFICHQGYIRSECYSFELESNTVASVILLGQQPFLTLDVSLHFSHQFYIYLLIII